MGSMINGKKLARILEMLVKELGREPTPSELRERMAGR